MGRLEEQAMELAEVLEGMATHLRTIVKEGHPDEGYDIHAALFLVRDVMEEVARDLRSWEVPSINGIVYDETKIPSITEIERSLSMF